jgi:(1->4)-alpha-D-glucan branching enzyme
MDVTPVIVSPYDAELFGHWWFEGPAWLESVLRLASEKSNGIETISAGDYLKQGVSHQLAVPAFSSWGDQGYSCFWINEENDWIYPFFT